MSTGVLLLFANVLKQQEINFRTHNSLTAYLEEGYVSYGDCLVIKGR
jgi:hypothetical protein